MAVTTFQHPFFDGCGSIPNDKLVEIEKIKSWIKTQAELPDLSDEFVYMFLHSNYSDIEKTKRTIEVYFSLRCAEPELFMHRSPFNQEIRSGLSSVYLTPLPKTTPEGYKVILMKLTDQDPNKFVHLHAAKALILFNDIRVSEDGIVPGYVIINDARGYTWTHLSKLNFHVLRVYMRYMQEAKPVRIKGLHILYSVKIVEKLMAIAKPFMKAELQKLIKIHTGEDLTEFFKYVPQEIMPEDYGGKEKSVAQLHDENVLLMEKKYPKWIEEEENFFKNAAKLRNKKNNDLTNGPETFQNLSID